MNLVPINGPNILAIGGITEIVDDYEPGSRSARWAIDEVRCNRTYTNRIKISTTSSLVGPMQVLGICPVRPSMYYRFPLMTGPTETDTGSFLQSMSAELASEDGRQWAVTLEYGPFDASNLLGSSYLSQGIIDPLDAALQVWWDNAKYQWSKVEDETPEEQGGPLPYTNTVGDALLDIPPTEETRPVLFVARNEPVFNGAYYSQYVDTVNADDFFGCPPGTVKCRDIKGDEMRWDADWGWVYRVTYQFEFRYDQDSIGYQQLVLNRGYRYFPGGTRPANGPVNCVDGNGSPATDAQLLKQNGDVLGQNDEPYQLQFNEFPQATFSDLNIPQGIFQLGSTIS